MECIHANKNKEANCEFVFTCFIRIFIKPLYDSWSGRNDYEYHSAKPEGSSVSAKGYKNLVENGDFGQTEDGSSPWTGSKAQGWSAWVDQKNSSADASTRVIEAKDGTITISSPEKLRAALHRMVPIEAKKKYKLRFKIKTDHKVRIAKVRIIEESGKDKRLWNSATTSGTKDWQTIEADYSPTLDVDKIKLELFYETGTGTVSFKDIELVEVADQLSEDSQTDKQLEEKIDLPIGKNMFFLLRTILIR